MQVDFKQIQIVFQAQIGPLNDLRRQVLTQVAEPPFMMGTIQQLPGAVAFVNQSTNEIIILTETQIDYRKEGANVDKEMQQASELIERIREALLLDGELNGIAQVVGHAVSDTPTTELSVENFTSMTEEELRARFPGLRGVGLRVTYEKPPYNYDLNVEPFFQDPSLFFLRLGAAWQSPLSVRQVVTDVSGFLDYIEQDVPTFISALQGSE